MLSEPLDNPLSAEFSPLLRHEAAQHGRVLTLMRSGGDPRMERRRIFDLEVAGVTGMIVVSVLSDAQLATVGPPRGTVPTVVIGRQRRAPGFSTVGPDYVSGAYAVVGHLIEHGHTTMAMVSGSPGDGLPEPRETGWRPPSSTVCSRSTDPRRTRSSPPPSPRGARAAALTGPDVGATKSVHIRQPNSLDACPHEHAVSALTDRGRRGCERSRMPGAVSNDGHRRATAMASVVTSSLLSQYAWVPFQRLATQSRSSRRSSPLLCMPLVR